MNIVFKGLEQSHSQSV